jgi:hypothetical protein
VRLSLVVSRFACGRLEAGVPGWVGNKKDAVLRPRLAWSGLATFCFSAETTLLRAHGVGGVRKAKKEAESETFLIHYWSILSGWGEDVNYWKAVPLR